MKKLILLISLLLGLSTAYGSARFDIDADAFYSKIVNGELIYVLEGNTSIIQTGLADLHADKMELKRNNRQEIEKLTARGSPLKLNYSPAQNDTYIVKAQRLHFSKLQHHLELIGKVTLLHTATTGERSEITGQRLDVKFNKDLELTALVIDSDKDKVTISHLTGAQESTFEAKAQRIEYLPKNNKFTLHDVELKRAGETFKAAVLEIDKQTGEVSAPKQPGSRVSISKDIKE